MSLSLAESQTIHEIAALLYNFLPGSTYRENSQSLTFGAVAQRVGVGSLWRAGSKSPALIALLEKTLDTRKELFCPLIVEVVRSSLAYNSKHVDPLPYEDIKTLNDLLLRLQFKIPDLWDPSFLASLPRRKKADKVQETARDGAAQQTLEDLMGELISLQSLPPVQRGFAFEGFLENLFGFFGLSPRGSFRLVGEQIDGSCQVSGATYLIEAKWQNELVGQSDLLVFSGKVGGKSVWSRGLFVSYSGFSSDGLEAFAKGRATNIVGITGQDLYLTLEEKMSLPNVISQKVRRAAESGESYVSVRELTR